jgi:hypothetical protein
LDPTRRPGGRAGPQLRLRDPAPGGLGRLDRLDPRPPVVGSRLIEGTDVIQIGPAIVPESVTQELPVNHFCEVIVTITTAAGDVAVVLLRNGYGWIWAATII